MINTSFWLARPIYDKLTAQALRDERSRNAYVCWLFAHGTVKPVEETTTGAAAFMPIRMPNDTHEAAKARAAEHGVTLSQLLRYLINGTA